MDTEDELDAMERVRSLSMAGGGKLDDNVHVERVRLLLRHLSKMSLEELELLDLGRIAVDRLESDGDLIFLGGFTFTAHEAGDDFVVGALVSTEVEDPLLAI